jgi:hypothetical protein
MARCNVPDAGSLLLQIEKQQHNPLPPKSAPQFEPPPPMQSLGGATVTDERRAPAFMAAVSARPQDLHRHRHAGGRLADRCVGAYRRAALDRTDQRSSGAVQPISSVS